MKIEDELLYIAVDKLEQGSDEWQTVLCAKDMVVEVRQALAFYEGFDGEVPVSTVVAKLKRILATVE